MNEWTNEHIHIYIYIYIHIIYYHIYSMVIPPSLGIACNWHSMVDKKHWWLWSSHSHAEDNQHLTLHHGCAWENMLPNNCSTPWNPYLQIWVATSPRGWLAADKYSNPPDVVILAKRTSGGEHVHVAYWDPVAGSISRLCCWNPYACYV